MPDIDQDLLVDSRNHFRSTAVIPVTADITPAAEFIQACINLIEPQVLINGEYIDDRFFFNSRETRVLDFTYNTGIPAAHAIGVFFFRNPGDLYRLQNPIVTESPSAIVNPQIPRDDPTGIAEQEGTLTVTAPEAITGENTEYWGALIIYQHAAEPSLFDGEPYHGEVL